MVTGRALVIFHDHRPDKVKASRERLRTELSANVKGVSGVNVIPLRLLFGQRPYHALAEIQAADEDTLLSAFKYIEDKFSHIDGFG